jgi:hypothetical protein
LLLHHDNAPSYTPFFSREFLTKNIMTVFPHPPYFPVSQLKIKLRGRHFDTTESQAVLNGLTEHDDFRNALQRQKRWERCIRAGDGDGGQ